MASLRTLPLAGTLIALHQTPVVRDVFCPDRTKEFSVDEDNSDQRELLKKLPDAAPWIPIRDSLSLKQFLQLHIWKGAIIEAIGKHKLNCMSN